jgi:hypothetical protein
MHARAVALGLLAAAVLCGGDKKSPLRSGENERLEIIATPLVDRDAVKQALGSDLGGHYILMDVRITPKEGLKVAVHLDDFVLKTNKDGERTTPFVPGQIAGRGAMVLTETASGGGHWGSPGNPTWGGYGPPMMNGGVMGGGGSDVPGETRATMKSGAKDKPDPLLDVLKQKVLPEKETDAAVSGLLYFPMEKQKLKDLELWYNTPEGKLVLQFK